uniref:Uncharacterized protein n=1 Tax=Myoviridae sp. ctgXL3 TaxID=2826681 RepID=A0A8S5QQY3_9CAUD|nr:MAG TPA: hypothetical protein [Myoviridae sp. ctgXL3]
MSIFHIGNFQKKTKSLHLLLSHPGNFRHFYQKITVILNFT